MYNSTSHPNGQHIAVGGFYRQTSIENTVKSKSAAVKLRVLLHDMKLLNFCFTSFVLEEGWKSERTKKKYILYLSKSLINSMSVPTLYCRVHHLNINRLRK